MYMLVIDQQACTCNSEPQTLAAYVVVACIGSGVGRARSDKTTRHNGDDVQRVALRV